MAEKKSRFVLLCQQSLALALVTAIAAPAANMVSLDIVAPPHALPAGGGHAAAAQQPGNATSSAVDHAAETAVVATKPVKPTVSTVPLSGVSKAGLRALAQPTTGTPAPGTVTSSGAARLVSAETSAVKADGLTVLSAPQQVNGLATVGVTWAHGATVPDQAITISVRTRTAATWSAWQKVPYHQDEGPDPTSAEGRRARPGTDPIYIGAVDDVQIKALTDSGTVPEGMRLSLVDPGQASAPAVEKPAIDTGALDGSASGAGSAGTSTAATTTGTAGSTTTPTTSGDASLSAAVTAKPQIFSRAQWGADEGMRDKSALHYGEVHGGFVHHTVNANNYTRAQVPAIIRGIYAYHTQSRGWSDVGYNFLVDRFGRIWEGRYGGVARPVVGAHTLGYNDDAFAMSAIGNYETARPSAALLDAYGRLFAWKLGLSGVRAGSTRQWVEKRYLPAIDGHRDVGQTACPGKYLYAQIPTIRKLAAQDQMSFAGRVRNSDLAGDTKPDMVVRKQSTKQAYIVRTASNGTAGKVLATGTYFPHANLVMNAGDWNGDGHGDVITRSGASGRLYLYRGNGAGRFARGIAMGTTSFSSVGLLAAVGDMTGDGHPDLLGQPNGGSMRIYPGNGVSGFHKSYVAHSGIAATQQLGVGLWDSDGAPDSVLRGSDGTLTLYPGNGPGGLTGGTRIGLLGRNYDWVIAVGDVTGDGRTDLVARATANGKLWLFPGASASGLGTRRAFGTHLRGFDLGG